MPIKIKRAFEREYGKKRGDKIFYAWENKRGMLPRQMHHSTNKTSELILKGNKQYISHMYKHLRKEHPSTKRRMRII